MKPVVVLAPHFRRMAEIFDEPTLARMYDMADVRWGRDEPMSPDDFGAAVSGSTAVVFGTWRYGPLPAAPRLRHLFEVAGSLRHPGLDFAACFQRGVTVASCAPAFGPAVAEMALALTLAAARLVTAGDAAFRRGEERWLHDGNEGARSLHGRTVGFVGAGNLARHLHRLLGPFGVTVLGHDPWVAAGELRRRAIEPVALDELFERSDIVYVLAVPTPSNRRMVSRELMELLQPTDVLVVISRAHLVDFDALTELVLAGRFRAAIDVFPEEPLPADHPIRGAAGAVLSAHRAGAIPEALLEIGRMVVDDLEALLAGRPPTRMQYATPELISRLGGEPAARPR